MTLTGAARCRQGVRAVAFAAGVAVALMLVLIAHYRVLPALALGAGLAAGLWLVLGWTFCTGLTGRPDPAPPAPPSPPSPPAAAPDAGPPPVPPGGAAPDRPAPPPASVPSQARAAAARKPAQTLPRRGGRSPGIDVAVRKSKAPARVTPGLEVLAAPRNGVADDLTRIAGIGPALSALLNREGIWHFDQIASWKARDIAYFESRMPGFRGRITRDGWVEQARQLARGDGE